MGIDGGYVRDWDEKKGHFEVIVGKSILAFKREDEEDIPSSKCFGFVQTFDIKPKRRLFEVLQSQGHQLNQHMTFLSDGGDTVRDLQLYLSPEAEHLLDWFHLAMRLTVLQQTAKGLPDQIRDEEATTPLRDPVVRELERLKWYLWHGNVYKALQVVQSVEMDLDVAAALGDRSRPQAPESHRGIPHLHREQPRVHSQLWRALPAGRADQHRLCGIDRQSGGQQALLQAAADAMDETRGTSAPPNAGQDTEPRVSDRIPPLVSQFPGPAG